MNARTLLQSDLATLWRDATMLELGALVQATCLGAGAGFREDGAVLLADGQACWPPTHPPGTPRELHLQRSSPARVQALRKEHRDLWLHGAASGGLDPSGALALAQAGVDSLSVHSGPAEAGDGPWCSLLDLPLPVVVSATYGPATPGQAILDRLERVQASNAARCLVWLPVCPGGRVLRPDDTDGIMDARLLALTRLALPARVRVRSSWSAFGWKMAQFLLTCGADEVAGRGLEEEQAWGPGFAPAAVVGAEQARAGVLEAGRQPVEVRGCAWES